MGEKHVRSCPEKKVSCEAKKYGCTERIKRKDKTKHENNCTFILKRKLKESLERNKKLESLVHELGGEDGLSKITESTPVTKKNKRKRKRKTTNEEPNSKKLKRSWIDRVLI